MPKTDRAQEPVRDRIKSAKTMKVLDQVMLTWWMERGRAVLAMGYDEAHLALMDASRTFLQASDRKRELEEGTDG